MRRLTALCGRVGSLWAALGGLSIHAFDVSSRVLRVQADKNLFEMSHPVRRWDVGDYACVVRGDKELACGSVIRITLEAATVKVDLRARSKEKVWVGDGVVNMTAILPDEAKAKLPKERAPTDDLVAETPPEPSVREERSLADATADPETRLENLLDSVRKQEEADRPPSSEPEPKLRLTPKTVVAPPAPPPPENPVEGKSDKQPVLSRGEDAVVEKTNIGDDEKDPPPKNVETPLPVRTRLKDEDKEKEKVRPLARPKTQEEAVQSDPVPVPPKKVPEAATPAAVLHRYVSIKPRFRVLYDVLLSYRPGLRPVLTFDSDHSFLWLMFQPASGVELAFDLAPSPRYYEVSYEFAPAFRVKAGRILVPFGGLSPHGYFGGQVNVLKRSPERSYAFLPDLWTDLGVSAHGEWGGGRGFKAGWVAFALNGFQSGGTDPARASSLYPNFSSMSGLTDNNRDKTWGARLTLGVPTFEWGVSYLRGRYSAENDPWLGLMMLGTDLKLKWPDDEFRVAGLLTVVDVISVFGATVSRRGVFGEWIHRFGHWRTTVRAGLVELDTGAKTAGDQMIVGGGIAREFGFTRIGLEFAHDVLNFDGKTDTTFVGLRASMGM